MSNRLLNGHARGFVAAMLLAIALPALAHHSFAVFFDQDRNVTVTGVVEEFQFRNPHGIIRIAVKKGSTTEIWKAETNSPSILERRGWTRDIIKPGETITIEGWPSRDGANYMRMRSVKRANGAMVGSAPISAAEAAGEQK
jgi:DNA/RNA endonuclease YhcR with UshA esterase domain